MTRCVPLRSVLPKGTSVLPIPVFVAWAFLAAIPVLSAQGGDPIGRHALATSLPDRTLFVVCPTFAAKHREIRQAHWYLQGSTRNRERADRLMAREAAYRDSFSLALAAAFREAYTLGAVALLPDTLWTLWRQGKDTGIPVNRLDGQTVGTDSRRNGLVLRKTASSRDTGTGMELWRLESLDGATLPETFPDVFREGSLGTRFVRFMEAFFTFHDRPETVADLRVVTDYLAGQVDRKWSQFMKRYGD